MKEILGLALLVLVSTVPTGGEEITLLPKECKVSSVKIVSDSSGGYSINRVYRYRVQGLFIETGSEESAEEILERVQSTLYIYIEVQDGGTTKSSILYSSNTTEFQGPPRISASIQEKKVFLEIEILGTLKDFLCQWNTKPPAEREKVLLILREDTQ